MKVRIRRNKFLAVDQRMHYLAVGPFAFEGIGDFVIADNYFEGYNVKPELHHYASIVN